MEPVRYLRTFRRRWWVIALAILVAGSAAWITTEVTASDEPAPTNTSADYGATVVLWNPGAATVGPGSPFMSTDMLIQFLKSPSVAAIAAESMDFQGSPAKLSARVQGGLDPLTGFLAITGIGPDPRSADTVTDAFSQALITYLEQLKQEQIDQQEQILQGQLTDLLEQGDAAPEAILSIRNRLAKLPINRTTPITLTEFQRQPAAPIAQATEATATDEGLSLPESSAMRVLLACLFGLLAGLALALVLERFDTRLRSSKRAEEAFGLPVLAEVPAISRGRRDGVVTATHPYSRAADAFRLVQVGTSRWASENGNGHGGGNGGPRSSGGKAILVTSPEARDGKTTVAANLAAAYAQAGNRVLVVSCDLRRPAIHEVFHVAAQPGLVDALRSTNGRADPTEPIDLTPYLEPCSILRVAVLPSGRIPQRPGELLSSVAMQRVGERLKKLTDVVIFDCAPLVVAGDVVPLLPLADGVVLVARAGKTRQALAASATALLERLGSANAGVVLNDAREFSIPLAKRGMYRPTRKMRKDAEQSPELVDEDTWMPESDLPESYLPERAFAPEPDTAPEPEVAREPEVVRESPAVVDDSPVNEQDEHVAIPDVVQRRSGPDDEGSTPRASDRGALETLQQELTQLRAELEGFQPEFPEGPTDDRQHSRPIGFSNDPTNEAPRG